MGAYKYLACARVCVCMRDAYTRYVTCVFVCVLACLCLYVCLCVYAYVCVCLHVYVCA